MEWLKLFGKLFLTLGLAIAGTILLSLPLIPLFPAEQIQWWSIFPQEAAFIGASFLAWIVF